MRWSFKSLFYNSYQKKLVDPGAYEKPMRADDLRPEIAAIRDYESRTFIERALSDAVDAQGNVTIAKVVNQIDTLEWAMKWETDNHMQEFGRDAKLGCSLLADMMVRKANQLAQSIQPGAKEKLGDALG